MARLLLLTPLLLLALTVSGCLHEIKFVPICEGTPSVMPCIGPCKVKVFATKVPTEELIPNALVIRDHLDVVRCQAVS